MLEPSLFARYVALIDTSLLDAGKTRPGRLHPSLGGSLLRRG
jgi:hypothetical protein